MPRVISTTWFEDIGYMNQPMFDFKLARLSIRQTAHLFLWAGVAYLFHAHVAGLFASSLMVRGIASLAAFTVGMGLFARKGKVFAPEWYVVHFARKLLPGLSSPLGGWGSRGTSRPDDTPVERGPKPMVAPMGEPTRIAGVLYDPSTGRRLPNVGYEVTVEGEPYHAGRTDGDGAYGFVYTPPSPGVFHLAVSPEGSSEDVEEIRVEARSASQSRPGVEEGSRAVDQDLLKTEETVAEEPSGDEPGRGEERYVYELFPTNFVDLSAEEQNRLVNGFRSFLNSLDREVKVIAVRSSKKVGIGETSAEPEFFKFFVVAEEPVDAKLDAAGFLYQRTTESPEPEIVHTFKDFVAVEGGRNERTATVYRMSERLVEGFPAELYGAADRVTVRIKPVDQGEAVTRVERFARRQRGMVASGGTQRELTEADRAQEAVRRLSEGASRLFRATINVTAGGDTKERMEDNYDRIESACRGRMVEIDDPMFVQGELLAGELGKELFLDTVTLGAFFPFVSSDVIEAPGGVFLGVNGHTGAPVIYDPLVRSNGHMALIGVTGSGKSFAAKTYLTRIFEKHPEVAFFIVDPENEYTKTATGLDPLTQVRHITRDRKLGLDPLKLFGSKDVVLHMLSDALDLGGDEPDLLSELRVGVQRSSSLEELRDRAGEKLGKRLDGLLEGPEKFLFVGDSKELSERVVFDLQALHQALKVTDERIGTLHIASLLVFGQIWQKIEELPRDKLKVVVVDEVWLYTALPAAASFLEHVSRRGRRRNVIFVLASQRPADVLESESGRAAIENCATKVILQQDEAAADPVRESFGLTEREVRASMEFDPGRAILTADNVKAPLKFIVSPDEYGRFTTKPGEVS